MQNNRKLLITEMNRLSKAEYIEREQLPLTILLDNVRSAQNVGSVFRTADAFRVEHILLAGISPCPPHPLIHKTALGAEEVVPFSYIPQAIDVALKYKQKGYEVWCLEQATNSVPLKESSLENRKVLLVAGNEVHGVSDELIEIADRVVEIPQFGTKHSLNVSVSMGIALYSILAPSFSLLTRKCEK